VRSRMRNIRAMQLSIGTACAAPKAENAADVRRVVAGRVAASPWPTGAQASRRPRSKAQEGRLIAGQIACASLGLASMWLYNGKAGGQPRCLRSRGVSFNQ
jgi:hypothetical protein